MNGAMAEDAELRCPECGYDLRGSGSGRCPECGSAFDRAQMSRSKIAWEHRREIGLMRAWWRTVWQATFRVKDLADSISAPADWHAARRFWLINALLLYLPIAVLLICFGEQWRAELSSSVNLGSMPMAMLGWWREVIVPVAAGLSIPGMLFVTLLGFVLTGTGIQTYLLQAVPLPREAQDRAATIGLYMSGGFVGGALLTVAGALVIMAVLFTMTASELAFSVSMTMSPLLMLAVAWSGIWRIYRRVTQARAIRSMLIALAIPGLWLLAGLVWLFVLPWCIGLLALVILSIAG